MSDTVENTNLYTLEIVSRSPAVRTYLMEKVLKLLNEEIDDAEIERLHAQDEANDDLDDPKACTGCQMCVE